MTGKRILDGSDTALAVTLFGVSAVLTLLLFLENAGNAVVYKVVFATLALAFDATKVVLWIRGTREGNAVFVALALALVGVSLVASAGSSLMIVSKDDAKVEARSDRIDGARRALASAEKELEGWQGRLADVPAEFTSQLKVVAAQLDKARQERDARRGELDALVAAGTEESSSAATMFDLIGRGIGMSAAALKLGFLLAVSLLLEASALATTYRPKPRKASAMSMMADATGVAHVLKNGRALCGKPAPFVDATRQSRSCTLCMERSLKDA